ncbi:YciI family protein [Pedobacter sp. SL55]|uniref:YciI family protein n=1 Tax=Pedobacter sp. SL55 TaxID=2995161 RepID=UPI002270CA3B|nr:YciI family protein [Pedobacter sp. SL55]WAC40628.1 YciI family protein [Pedobacter sp. SL55]
MKKILITLFFALFAFLSQAQEKPKYDEALAKKLGADNYGMKMYVLVILKTGSNTTATKAQTDSLFKGHMTNIDRLAKENKLVVAGPLAKNDKQYRGIFILNTKSLEEAKTWLATDPAVSAKLLDADIFNWYGSAALPEYLPYHDKVQKTNF